MLDMTATECACEELARQEEDYARALGESVGYEVRGDRLEVLGEEGGDPDLQEKESVAHRPRGARGNALGASIRGCGAVLRGFAPTLSFDSGTECSGYDGCQRFTGTYETDREEMWFTSTRVLEANCTEPVQLWVQEGVPNNGDYRLVDGRLEILSDEGNTFVYALLQEAP